MEWRDEPGVVALTARSAAIVARDFDLILGIAKPRGWTDDRRLVREGRMHVPYPASFNLRKLMIDGVLRLPHKNHKTEKEAEPDVCMDSY
jgi:hypothetical protein